MTSLVSFVLVNKTLDGRSDFDMLLIKREFITLYISFLNGPPEFGWLYLIYI